MPRRRASPCPLTVRVSHEAHRLEQQVMADAFERLLPILGRRLRPQLEEHRSPDQPTSDTVIVPRRKPA
jgi:hypothetical protein